jgi:hypothetical protein
VVGNKNLYIPLHIFTESLTVPVERFAMWFSFGVDSSEDQILERTYTKKGCVLPANNHLLFQAFFLDGFKPEAIPALNKILSIQKYLFATLDIYYRTKCKNSLGIFSHTTSIACSTEVYCFLRISMCI